MYGRTLRLALLDQLGGVDLKTVKTLREN